MRKAVALYHLLLCAIIGGIIALTLYGGHYAPRAVGLGVKVPGGEEETPAEIRETEELVESPKMGGPEPWYG